MLLNSSTSHDAEAADTLAGIVLLIGFLIEKQTSIDSNQGQSPVADGEQPIESTADFRDTLLALEFRLRNEQDCQ